MNGAASLRNTAIGTGKGFEAVRPAAARRRFRPMAVAMLLFSVLILLGLFGRIMTYPMRHDELMHVSPAVMLGEWRLYNDMGYNHLPNLPLLLHAVYRLTGDSMLLLSGRCVIFLLWLLMIGAMGAIAWRVVRSSAAAGAAIVLLVSTRLFLDQAGMLVTNNLAPIPFALWGFYFFLAAADRPDPKPWPAFLSGVSIAIAIGFKVNYIFVVPGFVAASLLAPAGHSVSARIRSTALPFAAGGIIGSLPTLSFLLADLDAFFAHTYRYFTQLHAGYFAELDVPKAMSFADKMQLAEMVWFSGAVLLSATLTLWCFVAGARIHGVRRHVASLDWTIWLALALVLCGMLVSFVPTPSFQQYYAPPIAFVIVLALLLFRSLGTLFREIALTLFVAAAAMALLTAAPRLFGDLPGSFTPSRWTGVIVHRQGVQMAQSLAGTAGRPLVATLSPIHVLEGGMRIYPEFAVGPFIYRVADRLSPRDRPYYRFVLPAVLPVFLDRNPPDGILTCVEIAEWPTPACAHGH